MLTARKVLTQNASEEDDNDNKNRRMLVFSLIYLTFFLDNVLLTVLVPIIPAWVRGESLALWAQTSSAASLAGLLNHTAHHHNINVTGSALILTPTMSSAAEQIIVGMILGVKALTQLVMAPVASAFVARSGPCVVLRMSTATLAAAALMFGASSRWSGHGSVLCAGIGRAAHGAGSAMAGVSGLALASAALPQSQRERALGALLGAVALGVLVGYPFGGAAYSLWSRGAPFLLAAAAILADLVLQIFFLKKDEFGEVTNSEKPINCFGALTSVTNAAGGVAGVCAGAVLLTTSVMASLEPCLPLWIMERFHPQKWQLGAVFIPDSAGYLIAASLLGGWSKKLGAERVAITGVAAVGIAAILVPISQSVPSLAWPHSLLGVGLGATDAALIPALLSRSPRKVHHLAALIQAASSAAYAIGPVCGGLISAWLGFPTTMRILGVTNLFYAAALYRVLRESPLSEQWGAPAGEEDSSSSSEFSPLQPSHYRALRNTTIE